jgi:hypothetical protein
VHLLFVGVIKDDDLAVTKHPKILRLSSPKSLWVNSKSREVPAMRSTSSEDEDRLITGAFLEGPPTRTPASKGDAKRSLTGILVEVKT